MHNLSRRQMLGTAAALLAGGLAACGGGGLTSGSGGGGGGDGTSKGDIKLGMLSVSAPIARAVIGKSQGDSVEVYTPKGLRSYEIIAVEYK